MTRNERRSIKMHLLLGKNKRYIDSREGDFWRGESERKRKSGGGCGGGMRITKFTCFWSQRATSTTRWLYNDRNSVFVLGLYDVDEQRSIPNGGDGVTSIDAIVDSSLVGRCFIPLSSPSTSLRLRQTPAGAEKEEPTSRFEIRALWVEHTHIAVLGQFLFLIPNTTRHRVTSVELLPY